MKTETQMCAYYVRVNYGKGRIINFSVGASSPEAAIQIILNAELCPRSAVIGIRREWNGENLLPLN